MAISNRCGARPRGMQRRCAGTVAVRPATGDSILAVKLRAISRLPSSLKRSSAQRCDEHPSVHQNFMARCHARFRKPSRASLKAPDQPRPCRIKIMRAALAVMFCLVSPAALASPHCTDEPVSKWLAPEAMKARGARALVQEALTMATRRLNEMIVVDPSCGHRNIGERGLFRPLQALKALLYAPPCKPMASPIPR